jgi:hypothetical protein
LESESICTCSHMCSVSCLHHSSLRRMSFIDTSKHLPATSQDSKFSSHTAQTAL